MRGDDVNAVGHREYVAEAVRPQSAMRWGARLWHFLKNPLRAASLLVVVGMIVIAIFITSVPLKPLRYALIGAVYLLIAAAFALGGCGQKGPLKLPDTPAPKPPVAAP